MSYFIFLKEWNQNFEIASHVRGRYLCVDGFVCDMGEICLHIPTNAILVNGADANHMWEPSSVPAAESNRTWHTNFCFARSHAQRSLKMEEELASRCAAYTQRWRILKTSCWASSEQLLERRRRGMRDLRIALCMTSEYESCDSDVRW